MNVSRRNLFIVLVVVLIALPLIYVSFWTFPQWRGDQYRARFTAEQVEKLSAHERILFERNIADIENSNRLTLAQIIGGLALLSGLYFTYQNVKTAQDNLRVTEEGKLTERFSKAVELLGSDKLDVRLGGIYALERIALDSRKDHWTVMEVLTSFIRENSNKKSLEDEKSIEPPETGKTDLPQTTLTKSALSETISPSEDIQAILTIIGRRAWVQFETRQLDLQKTNLQGSNLVGANLSNAKLNDANLIDAKLGDAKLNGAELSGANLSGADLSGTDLTDADLSGADLNVKDLNEANLKRANLKGAKMLTLFKILSAKNFETATLTYELVEKLKEWQAKQPQNKRID
jgi:uncharacterized protein YjbI with pentapeptide repeats